MAKYADITTQQPFEVLRTITTSDTTVYSPAIEYFYVGVAGDVAVTDRAGNVVTLKGCLAGKIYAFRVTKIMATNTTATNIVQCAFE